MSKLRVGIIGAGSIAQTHLSAYRQFPDACEIVATADIYRDKAEALANRIGPDVSAYGDYRQLLDRSDVDLVSVCTPPFAHAEVSIAALNAGKHVWVEKPMAASVAECDQMIEAASRNGKMLASVCQYRHQAEFWRAKALIASGAIGRLVLAKADCLWWRGRNYYDLWWRGTWEQECGGATINHAVHHIDGLLWLAGEPVTSVYAEMDTFTHDIEVEDLSCAVLRFQSGAVGQIVSTVSAHHNHHRIEIAGEEASLTLPGLQFAAWRARPNGFGDRDEAQIEQLKAKADAIPVSAYQGHAAQLEDVLQAIRTGRQPLVSGPEARRAIELITAMYKSATIGQRVTLPLTADDPFYTSEGIRTHVRRHPAPAKAKQAGAASA